MESWVCHTIGVSSVRMCALYNVCEIFFYNVGFFKRSSFRFITWTVSLPVPLFIPLSDRITLYFQHLYLRHSDISLCVSFYYFSIWGISIVFCSRHFDSFLFATFRYENLCSHGRKKGRCLGNRGLCSLSSNFKGSSHIPCTWRNATFKQLSLDQVVIGFFADTINPGFCQRVCRPATTLASRYISDAQYTYLIGLVVQLGLLFCWACFLLLTRLSFWIWTFTIDTVTELCIIITTRRYVDTFQTMESSLVYEMHGQDQTYLLQPCFQTEGGSRCDLLIPPSSIFPYFE